MFKPLASWFGTVAAAAAALFLGYGQAYAQRGHGGGHGGGFHGGGFHGGGFRGGSIGRGFSGGGFRGGAIYRGGVRSYGFARPYSGYRGFARPYYGYRSYYARPYYGYRGYGLGRNAFYRPYYRYGYGLGRYGYYRPYYGYGGLFGYGLLGLLGYGGYGYSYPYGYGGYGYGGYGSYVPYYSTAGYSYPYTSSTVVVNPTTYVAPSSGAQGQPPADNAIHLQLTVPADAEVLFDGGRTSQTGTVREYVSPAMTPGQTYTYHITVRYRGADGKLVEDRRDVRVRANDWFAIDFTRPAPAAPPAMPPATTSGSVGVPSR